MKAKRIVAAFLFLVGITSLPLPSLSEAALITETFNFTASNFTSQNGSAAPVNPVDGSVTITFDPLLDYGPEGVTSGITLNSLNISLDSPIAFWFGNNPSFSYGFMIIGGKDREMTVDWLTNDFWVSFFYYPELTFSNLAYSQIGINDNFFTDTGSVSAVPISGALWLLVSGIAGVAAVRRKRK